MQLLRWVKHGTTLMLVNMAQYKGEIRPCFVWLLELRCSCRPKP